MVGGALKRACAPMSRQSAPLSFPPCCFWRMDRITQGSGLSQDVEMTAMQDVEDACRVDAHVSFREVCE